MNRLFRSLLIVVGLIVNGFGIFGLTPGEMSSLFQIVSNRNPGDLILEVETESEWAPPLVSILLSTGQEVYLQVDGDVLESRREGLDRDERSARDEIEAGRFLPLHELYPVVLQELSNSRNFSFVGAEHFYSIGFDREYGRILVELEFQSNASSWSLGNVDGVSSASQNWDNEERTSRSTWPSRLEGVKVYADPTNGRIISVDTDD